MEINITLIAELLTVLFMSVSVFFGVLYYKTKKTLREVAEAIAITSDALQDDELTKEELSEIVKEWQQVVEVWR